MTSYGLVRQDRRDEFTACGYKQRHFFPHRVYHLPKCGPDGFKLADWMCGVRDPAAMWEIVLFGEEEVLAEFPRELFFDDELIWHQQQFGRPGQVATASLVVKGSTVSSITHVSDLFQRISRRREHKTRVEKVFAGWNHMLLNAVLNFALACGAKRLRMPMATLASRHTDRSRTVDFTIFERIYDRTINSVFAPKADGAWWTLELASVRNRIVVPDRCVRPRTPIKTVSICHDLERGIGHQLADPSFARWADDHAPAALKAITEVERSVGVRATYCVVGAIMDEVRTELENDGHCVAFHSFDHRLKRRHQLQRCREVDYRIKGYRPPNSRITRELTDRNLLFHNFEWLASSPESLATDEPQLRRGVVRLPISQDDRPLHTGALAFEEWEARALAFVAEREFTAISLHDCYAHHWLDRYREFLERVGELAEYRSLNDVAVETTLESAAPV